MKKIVKLLGETFPGINILFYILFGFIFASIVVFIFITLSSLTIVSSGDKDQEDQEQIQWINDYGKN